MTRLDSAVGQKASDVRVSLGKSKLVHATMLSPRLHGRVTLCCFYIGGWDRPSWAREVRGDVTCKACLKKLPMSVDGAE